MIANEGPLNFISGSPVALEPVLRNCNKKEFHHVYPKKYLIEQGIPVKEINSLLNFVMLSKADNNKLGGNRPSLYKPNMKNNEEAVRLILKRALCPEDIFHDDNKRFFEERIVLLINKANELMGFPKQFMVKN
jgi:hypothetical protein